MQPGAPPLLALDEMEARERVARTTRHGSSSLLASGGGSGGGSAAPPGGGGGGGGSGGGPTAGTTAPLTLVAKGNVQEGDKGVFSTTRSHYVFDKLLFDKKALDAILVAAGAVPSVCNIAFLLAGPGNPSDMTYCLRHVHGSKAVVLPHPRWFLDKMARPALDLNKTPSPIPAFFK